MATLIVIAFSPNISIPKNNKRFSSTLFYVRDQPSPASPVIITPLDKKSITKDGVFTTTKPKIRDIKSMSEFQYFLEEDDRPVAVKFYAPWCKTCKRLGLHFDRLAIERGDVVRDRQKIQGQVRFAAVEYGSETARFITEKLQIKGVPTLQLYHGIHKLWEENGATSVKGLKQELDLLMSLSNEEIRSRAEQVDDCILKTAIEDSFFDGPDFLDEEW